MSTGRGAHSALIPVGRHQQETRWQRAAQPPSSGSPDHARKSFRLNQKVIVMKLRALFVALSVAVDFPTGAGK
jgi:hypothetical protein